MREIGPDEAYALAIELDTLDGYAEFVEAYPRHRAIRRARLRDHPRAARGIGVAARAPDQLAGILLDLSARYPDGIYASDARRRLRRLSVGFAPPPGFAPVEFYDVPPPLPDEPVEYSIRALSSARRRRAS